MKRGIVVLSLALSLLVAGPVSVNALSNSSTSDTPTNKTASTEDKSPAEVKTRVEERKARLKTKLDNKESVRVSGLCVAAQAKANAVLRKLNDDQTPYQDKYNKYSKRIADLQEKLKASGRDTNEINSAVSAMNQKYQVYKTSLEELNASMTDITTMDCKSEPSGFKATLQDARNQIKATNDARKEVTNSAKEVVKALKSLKDKN